MSKQKNLGHWRMVERLAREVNNNAWPYGESLINSGDRYLSWLMGNHASIDPRFALVGFVRNAQGNAFYQGKKCEEAITEFLGGISKETAAGDPGGLGHALSWIQRQIGDKQPVAVPVMDLIPLEFFRQQIPRPLKDSEWLYRCRGYGFLLNRAGRLRQYGGSHTNPETLSFHIDALPWLCISEVQQEKNMRANGLNVWPSIGQAKDAHHFQHASLIPELLAEYARRGIKL